MNLMQLGLYVLAGYGAYSLYETYMKKDETSSFSGTNWQSYNMGTNWQDNYSNLVGTEWQQSGYNNAGGCGSCGA